jgi:hypothetical protein
MSALAFVVSAPLWLALLRAIGQGSNADLAATAPLAILRVSQILGLPHGVGPLVESIRAQEPSRAGQRRRP